VSEIRPALTANAWKLAQEGVLIVRAKMVQTLRNGDEAVAETLEMNGRSNVHACAALALYRQPFGFTRDDVDALRIEARDLRVHAGNCREWHDVEATLEFERSYRIIESLAERIKSLLPPEDS
jgi:hypothetical protein